MILERVAVRDILETNSYFYIDENTGHGFLIDPGAEAEKLIQKINDNNWIIEKILLTHGHFDHIGAVEALHNSLNIPYFIHKNGADYLNYVLYNLSAQFGRNIVLKEAEYLEDGDSVHLSKNDSVELRLIHVPGHTTDSSIFYDAKNCLAFVGDTIFKNSVGNTAFPGGDSQQLADSIFNKIFKLPSETVLYSGHSEETSVEIEKGRYSPFFGF